MTECILICAICVVGVTQMVKNMLSDGDITTTGTKKIKGWIWTLITIFVSIAIVCAYEMLPSIVIECVLVLSTASLFYDTIYKSFDKLIKNKLTGNKPEEHDGCGD
jgi:hypothetical protein